MDPDHSLSVVDDVRARRAYVRVKGLEVVTCRKIRLRLTPESMGMTDRM